MKQISKQKSLNDTRCIVTYFVSVKHFKECYVSALTNNAVLIVPVNSYHCAIMYSQIMQIVFKCTPVDKLCCEEQ